MSSIQPRGWQKKAIRKFEEHSEKTFLLEATPGAGKTIFSGLVAKHYFDTDAVDFVVVVVPTVVLKGDGGTALNQVGGFIGDFSKIGLELTPSLKSGRGLPRDFNGGVVTYAQLTGMVETLKTWASQGTKLFFIFDEVHHSSDKNSWGSAASECGDIATKILGMSGTPFRGDGKKISFVNYDENEKAIVDYRYSYREAIADNVCRQVIFTNDGGMVEYNDYGENFNVDVSTVSELSEIGKAARTLFSPKISGWLTKVIKKADEKLNDYRLMDDSAGGIIICRAGEDDYDSRHVHAVAKLVRELTGETPEVVTCDDGDASEKIARFRNGRSKWICSVRMISEGVDIKRLRVMVLAQATQSELQFRQMVGRVVRVVNPEDREDASVFIADFPHLREFAKTVEMEASAGLNDQQEARTKSEPTDLPQVISDFFPIGATHADGSAILDGETYAQADIEAAQAWQRANKRFADWPISELVEFIKKSGIEVPTKEIQIAPLHVQKKEMRNEISDLCNSIANHLNRLNGVKGEDIGVTFRRVRNRLNEMTGVGGIEDLFDNHSVEKIRECLSHAKNWKHSLLKQSERASSQAQAKSELSAILGKNIKRGGR
jgi:superfamily II DNA or RNA helicase